MSDQAKTRRVTVTNPQGLHARPAHALAQLAKDFQAEIQIIREGESADGKSILSIMTLAAGEGEELTLWASGDDAQQALDALENLFLTDFTDQGNTNQGNTESQLPDPQLLPDTEISEAMGPEDPVE